MIGVPQEPKSEGTKRRRSPERLREGQIYLCRCALLARLSTDSVHRLGAAGALNATACGRTTA